MKQTYISKRFSAKSENLINLSNEIIEEYTKQGYDLTLRQLYYQLVSRDYIVNDQKQYARLSKVISDARLAGQIDWYAIVDRTRNLRKNSHWSSPKSILDAVASQYRIDKWQNQKYRVECWIEKDALIGVISGICDRLDIPYFACRGYNSQSEMWRAGQRFEYYIADNQIPVILHLGDHDPSGMDMSRDIEDRINIFVNQRKLEFKRLALNYNQVKQYSPPPNPTKLSDSRSSGYIEEFGESSWELDALSPKVISDLIEENVLDYRDENLWMTMIEKEENERSTLQGLDQYLKG